MNRAFELFGSERQFDQPPSPLETAPPAFDWSQLGLLLQKLVFCRGRFHFPETLLAQLLVIERGAIIWKVPFEIAVVQYSYHGSIGAFIYGGYLWCVDSHTTNRRPCGLENLRRRTLR